MSFVYELQVLFGNFILESLEKLKAMSNCLQRCFEKCRNEAAHAGCTTKNAAGTKTSPTHLAASFFILLACRFFCLSNHCQLDLEPRAKKTILQKTFLVLFLKRWSEEGLVLENLAETN